MSRTRRLVRLALLVGTGLSLFLLEGLVPLPFLPPGAKLGISNIVTVLALYALPGLWDALSVLLLRVVLSSLLGAGPVMLLYSLGGGLLAFAAMALLRRAGRFSVLGVSAAGGFFHNAGQIAVASLVMESPRLWGYLPILGACGLGTGWLVGIAAQGTLHRLPGMQRGEA